MKNWFKCAIIRAIKTIAQTAVALIPVAVNVTEVDWLIVAGTSLTAGILSLLTSVAGLPEIRRPSLTRTGTLSFLNRGSSDSRCCTCRRAGRASGPAPLLSSLAWNRGCRGYVRPTMRWMWACRGRSRNRRTPNGRREACRRARSEALLCRDICEALGYYG